MLRLLSTALTLAAVFASTFLLINLTGLVTIADIKQWLLLASTTHATYVGMVVIFLLFLDLFIAVPTLTIVTLSGYFMGPVWGAIASIAGMWAAGLSGYLICFKWGEKFLLNIYKDPTKLDEMKRVFEQNCSYVLMLCRALPILPEVSCCLAGANQISFRKFFVFYSIGTIPYATLAALAGSKSSLDDPSPAILGAISISATLWLCWYLFWRFYRK